jgi:hypothetical protein
MIACIVPMLRVMHFLDIVAHADTWVSPFCTHRKTSGDTLIQLDKKLTLQTSTAKVLLITFFEVEGTPVFGLRIM